MDYCAASLVPQSMWLDLGSLISSLKTILFLPSAALDPVSQSVSSRGSWANLLQFGFLLHFPFLHFSHPYDFGSWVNKYPGLLSGARYFVIQGLNTSLFTDTVLCFWIRRARMGLLPALQPSLVPQWQIYLRHYVLIIKAASLPKEEVLVWELPLPSLYLCYCQGISVFY